VLASTGIVTTVAGHDVKGNVHLNGDSFPFGGDGGLASRAGLAVPLGLTVDVQGDLYIADSLDQRVRAIRGSHRSGE